VKARADKKQKTAIFIANDALKSAMEEFIREYKSIFKELYNDFAATQGTAKLIQSYLPGVRSFGHGPSCGDLQAVEEARKRTTAGQEVHIYAFFDWKIDGHRNFIEAVKTSALVRNWVWFPTPAAGQAYLDAIKKALEQKAELTAPEPVDEERQRQKLQAKADALLAELDAIAESIVGAFDSAEDIRQIRKERTDRL
jgi:methylglyoxal synthase